MSFRLSKDPTARDLWIDFKLPWRRHLSINVMLINKDESDRIMREGLRL